MYFEIPSHISGLLGDVTHQRRDAFIVIITSAFPWKLATMGVKSEVRPSFSSSNYCLLSSILETIPTRGQCGHAVPMDSSGVLLITKTTRISIIVTGNCVSRFKEALVSFLLSL